MLIIALLAIGSQRAWAQQTASINGTVVDPSGAGIPGAELVLTNEGTGVTRQTVTSVQGYFNFTDLSAAQYSIRVSAKGFEVFTQSGIILDVGQQITVQPALRIGAATQVVSVTGTPPPVTTSSASIEQTVQSDQLENLPLNGRNPVQLLALTPGVIYNGAGGQFGLQPLTFNGPGGRSSDMNFSLDGGTNNAAYFSQGDTYPNPDALQEFTVSTRDISATLGHGSTGIAAQTKSGTNQVHGSAYEFVRNSDMDSRSFFSPTVNVYKRNQFGGTVGGPIVKNKLFFFASYQRTVGIGTPTSTQYQTLSAAERVGNFAQICTSGFNASGVCNTSSQQLKNPAGGTFANNQISPISTTFAANYMQQFLPAANDPTGNFYIFTPVSDTKQNQVIGHVDYAPEAHDRISFRYFLDRDPALLGRTTAPSALEASTEPTLHQNWTLSYTHVFSSTLLNEFHATYNRDAFGNCNYGNGFPQFNLLGLNINTSDNGAMCGSFMGQSHMSVSGYWSDSDAVPIRIITPNTEIGDMASWVHGAHTLRFGGQLYRDRSNVIQNFLTNGNITYNGFETGNAGADFLLGYASAYNQQEPTFNRNRQELASFYIQDDFRATRRLTFNLGLRWEPVPGVQSQNNEASTFIPGVQSTIFPLAPLGELYAGDDGLPSNIVGTRWDNLAPRVGIAWDVFGNGKTSLRSSFATFYVPPTASTWSWAQSYVPPYDFNLTLNNINLNTLWSTAPYNGVDPFPFPLAQNLAQLKTVAFPSTATTYVFGLPFKTPVQDQWSMSVQHAMGTNAVLEVVYIGSSDAHQFTSFQANPAVYSATATSGNIQSRRLYPLIGTITEDANALSYNYNALEITFRKRYSQHVMLLSTYTWSREFGVNGCESSQCGAGMRDPFDHELDYGPCCNLDHNWVTSFIYNVPFGEHSSSRLVRSAIAGWQVDAINTVYSGPFLSVTSGKDPALNGDNAEDADLIGNTKIPGPRTKAQQIAQWFNIAAFAQPATGTFGTAGKGIMNGPGYWDMDFGLYKVFSFNERFKLQIRGQAYNVFNHVALGNPTTTLSSGTFGRITGTNGIYAPRVMELGAHLVF
jgi:hypothetical protein